MDMEHGLVRAADLLETQELKQLVNATSWPTSAFWWIHLSQKKRTMVVSLSLELYS